MILSDFQRVTTTMTQNRSYRGRLFTGRMAQPTVSEHWRKTTTTMLLMMTMV